MNRWMRLIIIGYLALICFNSAPFKACAHLTSGNLTTSFCLGDVNDTEITRYQYDPVGRLNNRWSLLGNITTT
jgi:hypothetical protein